MRKVLLVGVAALVAVALLGSTGCRRVRLADAPDGSPASVSTETTRVALGEAEALETTIRMGVGELKVYAGEASSTVALDGTFNYAPASWRPEVAYRMAGTRGLLSISQPERIGSPSFRDTENTWLLAIAPDIPTDLSLRLGVGESNINLRGVDVTGLDVVTGVGEAKIDLSGARTHDLTADIECGVGEVTVSVPSGTGVRISRGSEDGLGDLEAEGFREDGRGLVNSSWSVPGPRIELNIRAGIGDVKVISVD